MIGSEAQAFSGYHGTSVRKATLIVEEGFAEGNGPVCFALMDNLTFAQSHGVRRAEEEGDESFGVIVATFPTRRVELGMHGDQVVVPELEVGRISVSFMMEFEILENGLSTPVQRE